MLIIFPLDLVNKKVVCLEVNFLMVEDENFWVSVIRCIKKKSSSAAV